MNNTDKFVSTFGMTTPGDEDSLVSVVSHAVREGFAIVLCKPGDKIPLCILTERDKKLADEEARETSRLLGDDNWAKRRHGCGIEHALTVESLGGDPAKVRTKVAAMIKRVGKRYDGTLNVGVHLGLSRMMVVDMDTKDQVDGFSREWIKQVTGDGRYMGTGDSVHVPSMTVKSPGFKNTASEWIHKDGGHYWFSIPDDVELPSGQEAISDVSGYVVLWGNHQVLVPPSVRKEGAYQIIGGSYPAEGWLIAKVLHEAKARIERVQNRGEFPDGTGDIDSWAASVPWGDFLLPDGWTDTGIPDRCSCPIFTAPGSHASPKSATAHDSGCAKYDTSPGHAPIHIWTDNPPEWLFEATQQTNSKTFTKLQYVAWRDYGGNTTEALIGLGFNHAAASTVDLETWTAPQSVETFSPPLSEADDAFDDVGSGLREVGEDKDGTEDPTAAGEGKDNGGDVASPAETVEEDPDSWKTIKLWELSSNDLFKPTLMPRSDCREDDEGAGIHLLYRGLMHSFIGANESAKSWILQAEAVRIAKTGGTILWLDFENDALQVVQRFRALGATDSDLQRIDFRNPEAFPQRDSPWWHGMFKGTYDLIVLDGLTDALGIFDKKSNDDKDIADFYRLILRRLARETGAALATIDHQVKDASAAGRFASGSAYKGNGIDGAVIVMTPIDKIGRNLVGKIRVQVGKDKQGWIRGKSIGFDSNRLSDIGVFIIDATDPQNVITHLDPPDDPTDTPAVPPEDLEPQRDSELELRILRALWMVEPHGMGSQNKLISAVGEGARRANVIMSIELLEKNGELMIAAPNGTKPRLHKITEAGIKRLGLP